MVNTFYNSPYDVREVEGKILAQKISDCVYYGGKMNPLFNSNGVFREEFKETFMDKCNLNFAPNGEFKEEEYYFSISFLEEGEKDRVRFFLEEGNLNWKNDCNIKDVKKEKLSKCVTSDFWAVDPTGKVYLVKILTIINKVEENAN